MSLTNLSLAGNVQNYSRSGRVWLETSRQGTGKSLTFLRCNPLPHCTWFGRCCPWGRICVAPCLSGCRGWGGGRGSAGMRGRWRGWSAPGPAPAACSPPRGSDYAKRQQLGQSRPPPLVRRCYGTTAAGWVIWKLCAWESPPWAMSLCPHYHAVGYEQSEW